MEEVIRPMEETLWVELLSRHHGHAVTARHRFAGPEVRIGRGYGNELFVDDPKVAADHLRLFHDSSGALFAETREHGRVTTFPVDGDKPIRIGDTFLRVRPSSYVIVPEPAMHPGKAPWLLDLGLAAALAGLELLAIWLQETGVPQTIDYLRPILTVFLAALVWVGCWSIATRAFLGHARFAAHLRIALLGLVAYRLLAPAVSTLAFSLSLSSLDAYGYVAASVILGTMCMFHLREVGHAHLRMKLATVSALTVALIAFITVSRGDAGADAARDLQYGHELPPILRLVPSQSDAAFLAKADQLRIQLDQDRTKEPPPGSSDSRDGDDE